MFLRSKQSELPRSISVVYPIDRSSLNVLSCVEVDLIDGSNLLSNVDWTTNNLLETTWGCNRSGALATCF